MVETIARYQSRLLDMAPKAIAAYEEALASGDLHLAAATATKILEDMQVLHKGGIEQTIQMANLASPEAARPLSPRDTGAKDTNALFLAGLLMDSIFHSARGISSR